MTAPTDRQSQKATERVQEAEYDALIKELFARRPGFDCFCGDLDTLRAVVADARREDQHRAPHHAARQVSWEQAEPEIGDEDEEHQ